MQFDPLTVILQYVGDADTLPGTAADTGVVSFTVDPPKDQPSLAVNVVDLLDVTGYQFVDTLALQFVVLTTYQP